MAEQAPRNHLAVVSMVFGVIGAVFLWFSLVNLICGSLAIGLGVTAIRRSGHHRGPAIAGVVLGIPPFVTFWLVTIDTMSRLS